MPTVKCPQCSTALKLQQAPASGRIKCPKCGAVIPVRPTAPAAAVGGPRRSLTPDDDGFDFSAVQFPTAAPAAAVTHFPVQGNLSPYTGPIPGDPLEAAAQNAADAAGPPPVAAPSGKKLGTGMLLGIVGGVTVLLIALVVVGLMLGRGGGSAGAGADVLAEAQAAAPQGYSAVGIYGCAIVMPNGTPLNKVPSAIESKAILSSGSDSVYYLGAMDAGKLEIDDTQMRKKASRMLGGDILGGTPCERNGYKGIKGMLDGSLFLPRMQVEIFVVDERFAIIGCAPASMGADPSVPVDRKLEAEEQKVFYDSFKIGPKPRGFLF